MQCRAQGPNGWFFIRNATWATSRCFPAKAMLIGQNNCSVQF